MQRTWIKSVTAFVLLAAANATASAQGPGAVRKMAESSMLVTGHVVIEPDGSTARVDIDRPEALPKEIVGFVTESAREWKFKPVEQGGKIVRARAPMTVRVVAKKADGNRYAVEIRSASFGDDRDGDQSRSDGTTVQAAAMPPPNYPQSAVENGVFGTVFVVLRIDREGKVVDAIAEQTNLKVAARENDMRKFRRTLEQSSLAAARKWRFTAPTVGEQAKENLWSVRVAVAYGFDDPVKDPYGRWETYIPGPRSAIPWEKASASPTVAGSMDALMNGQLQQLGVGPQLLTPLGAS